MKTFAYLRVSTNKQDINSQKVAVLELAAREGMIINEYVETTISSGKSITARGIDDLLGQMQTGDKLLVSELSRLGRSVGQVVKIVDRMIKQGVHFFSAKENIRLIGQHDMQTKVMITLFSLMAELEIDLIRERTKEGIANARAKGKQIGRPKGKLGRSKLDRHRKVIKDMLRGGVSQASIARYIGFSKTALRYYVLTRNL